MRLLERSCDDEEAGPGFIDLELRGDAVAPATHADIEPAGP
jgi:hypothetical protein